MHSLNIKNKNKQIGIIAYAGGAANTGKTFLQQLIGPALLPTLGSIIVIAAASFAPTLRGGDADPRNLKDEDIPRPMTAKAEVFNSRVAMVGIAAIIVQETVKGQALISP
jgi:hypothetical protein